MPKELLELLNKIKMKKEEGKQLLNAKKFDEAQAIADEVKALEKEFDVASALYEETRANIVIDPVNEGNNGPVNHAEVFAKALRREGLTDVENALITGGSNGENNIIPVDVNTRITELRRSYKQARNLIGYYPTTTLTGSFVYEDTSTITELTNFTDGTDTPASNDPKFTTIQYAVKEYGALLPISNVLLQNETGGLIDYVGNWFNKKAIKTENKVIFDKLKSNKTAKAVADWKALKKSLNIDLDPEQLIDCVIVTNQDGFDVLDAALDGQGRPVLQPNPTNPTQRLFMGYPVDVFSNALLPTTGTTTKKAPIFYGSLKSGATFVSRQSLEFASSTEAGFAKNQTLIRVIEFFDVIQADKDAYVFGELTIA